MDEDQKLIDDLEKVAPVVSPDPNFKARLRSELIERARNGGRVPGVENVKSAFMSWTFSLQLLFAAVVVVVAVGISSDYLTPMGTKTDYITNESVAPVQTLHPKSVPATAPGAEIGGSPDVDALMSTAKFEGGQLDFMGMIRVYNFRPGALLENGAVIKGAMTSDWFWEGTSFARVEDEQGTQLGFYYVLTSGPAGSDDFHPFELAVDRQEATTATGWLIFEQSTGSGLPEDQNKFRIPVRFE